METTIRNLDEEAYRALRNRAVTEGRDVGTLLNEAMSTYLARVFVERSESMLPAPTPKIFSEGDERLSRQIDAIVYRNWRP